jgi:hypothetical protein
MLAAPCRDALHDEEPLPWLDEPEPPRLAHQLRARVDRRDPLLQLDLLGLQGVHLGLVRLELVLRVQVRMQRLPVEEAEEHDGTEREQTCGLQAHERELLRGTWESYALYSRTFASCETAPVAFAATK